MKKTSLIFLLFLAFTAVKGQDFHYSQFYAAPLYLNPAMAGSTEWSRAGVNYRKQWPGLAYDFNSYSAYFDHYSYDLRSGMGIAVNTFQESNMKVNTSDISLFYSYNLRISEFLNFRMGTQAGLFRRSTALDNILFGDQIDLFTRSVSSVSIDDFPNFEPHNYVDISFGGLLTGEYFWLGGSAHHINKPNISFFPSDQFSSLPVKWSVHGGYTFPLGTDNYFGSDFDNQISVMVNYKNQKPFQQLDIGTQAIYKMVISGISYRGIPGVRNMPNQDSIIFLLGLALENGLVIGYSYDFMISRIGSQTKGAHEISMRYQFLLGDPKKRSQRSRVLRCFNYML